MKILDRINLVIFSVIMLIVSLTTCFVIAGWLELDVIFDLVKDIISTKVGRGVTLGVAVVFSLMATKSIF